MNVRYGDASSGHGPGVEIKLDGNEVAQAICAYLVAHGVYVAGPRTVLVNDWPCESGRVVVDPAGFVISDGVKFSGRGST